MSTSLGNASFFRKGVNEQRRNNPWQMAECFGPADAVGVLTNFRDRWLSEIVVSAMIV